MSEVKGTMFPSTESVEEKPGSMKGWPIWIFRVLVKSRVRLAASNPRPPRSG